MAAIPPLASGMATDRKSRLTAVSRATGISLSALRIECTPEHFLAGTKCDAANCMFKVALSEKLLPLGFANIRVDIREIRFSYPPARLRFGYVTPSSLATKIRKWDEGSLDVEDLPFTYVLSVPRLWTMTGRSAGRPRRGPATPAEIAAREKGLNLMLAGRGITRGQPRRTRRADEIPQGRLRQYGMCQLEAGSSVVLEN